MTILRFDPMQMYYGLYCSLCQIVSKDCGICTNPYADLCLYAVVIPNEIICTFGGKQMKNEASCMHHMPADFCPCQL